MTIEAKCGVCGSTLWYGSAHLDSTAEVADEQQALTKWLDAHALCRAYAARCAMGKEPPAEEA